MRMRYSRKWTISLVLGGLLVAGMVVFLWRGNERAQRGFEIDLDRITLETGIRLPESARLLESNYSFWDHYVLHAKLEMSPSDVDEVVNGLREWSPIEISDESSENRYTGMMFRHPPYDRGAEWWDTETAKRFTLVHGYRHVQDSRKQKYHQRLEILIRKDTPRPVVYIYWSSSGV